MSLKRFLIPGHKILVVDRLQIVSDLIELRYDIDLLLLFGQEEKIFDDRDHFLCRRARLVVAVFQLDRLNVEIIKGFDVFFNFSDRNMLVVVFGKSGLYRLKQRSKHFVEGFAAFLAVRLVFKEHRLCDLLTDAHDGVERRQRILEDHCDLVSAQLVHLLFGNAQKVTSVVKNFSALINRVHRRDPHDRFRCNGLTRARLSDDRQRFSLVQIERDITYSLYLTCIRAETDLQIID